MEEKLRAFRRGALQGAVVGLVFTCLVILAFLHPWVIGIYVGAYALAKSDRKHNDS